MDLVTLTAEVKDELNKKNLSDAVVKSKIRTAIRSLEMKEAWNYMRGVTEFTLNTTGPNLRRINQPVLIKKLDFIRTINEDGSYNYLHGVNPDDFTSVSTGEPEGYYKDKFDYFWVDSVPARTTTGEIFSANFTAWEDADAFSPWIINVCYPLVMYESIILLAPYLREIELMQVYTQLRADALSSALVMNEEYQYSDQRLYMEYGQ